MAIQIRCSCCGRFVRNGDPKDVGTLGKVQLCESCFDLLNLQTEYVKAATIRAHRQISALRDWYTRFLNYVRENGILTEENDK